jgi:hypothetical protein
MCFYTVSEGVLELWAVRADVALGHVGTGPEPNSGTISKALVDDNQIVIPCSFRRFIVHLNVIVHYFFSFEQVRTNLFFD